MILVAKTGGQSPFTYRCVRRMVLKKHPVLGFWIFIVVLIPATLLAACSQASPQAAPISNTGPGAPTPVVVRILNLSGLASAPTPSPPPTWTPQPAPATSTPASGAASPAVQATSAQAAAPTPACLNQATLVRHLTLADNTAIKTGMRMLKSWRLQNTGTCPWTTAYSLILVGGENMLADPSPALLPQAVPPGDSVDLSVSIQAPNTPGSYGSAWMLRDAAGNLFGLGQAADQPIAMFIIVQSSEKNLPT